MARPPRADEAGGLYHALNRGNLRATIFHKEGDYVAFEKILAEGLDRYRVELFSYQLMPNHYHLVIRPLLDGEMSRQEFPDPGRQSFLRRLSLRRTQCASSRTSQGCRGLAMGLALALVTKT